jgi:hypothetical protein
MLVWCWQGTRRLLDVGVLVLVPSSNLDDAKAVRLIALNELASSKVPEESIHVAFVIGEDLRLDLFRPVFEASLAVCQRPDARKQEAAQGLDLGKKVIGEEARLDVPRSCHRLILPRGVTPELQLP